MLPLIDDPSLSPLIRGVLNSITFLLSLVLLERSADVFVDSTAVVAKRLGISTVLVGLLTAGAEWEEVRSDVRTMYLTCS
jgi:Ca2+/Na+ antiporter